MKKMLKVVAVVMAVAMCLVAFVGCNKTATQEQEPVEEIVMGTNAEFAPFEFIDENGYEGKYAGIDIEIAKYVAEKLGKKLVINDMQFDSLLNELSNGKVDFVVAGMTVDPERAKQVDFTDTYYVANQKIIKRADDASITDFASIKDKKVGVVTGYTADSICTKAKVKEVVRFQRGVDAVLELANKKLDAVVIDSYTAEKMVEGKDEFALVEDADAFESEEYAMAVKKGNKELLDALNAALKELKESGKINEFSAMYQ